MTAPDRQLSAVASADPEFATVVHAARRLGVGVKALRGAVRRGEVPAYALGTRGRPRVCVAEVRAWALSTAIDRHAEARAAGDRAARERMGGAR